MKKFCGIPLVALLLLTGCGEATKVNPTPKETSALAIPTDCEQTKVLETLNTIVPDSLYIPTQWQPAAGTELADFLKNGGLACSFGIQSAEIGTTVKWVSDSAELFEKRIPEWVTQGFTKVDIADLDESAAYFQLKKQSATQEFHIWIVNMKYHGAWVQVSCTAFAQDLNAGIPIVKAAVA